MFTNELCLVECSCSEKLTQEMNEVHH